MFKIYESNPKLTLENKSDHHLFDQIIKIPPKALQHDSSLHFKKFHRDSDGIKISLQFLSIVASVLKQQPA